MATVYSENTALDIVEPILLDPESQTRAYLTLLYDVHVVLHSSFHSATILCLPLRIGLFDLLIAFPHSR